MSRKIKDQLELYLHCERTSQHYQPNGPFRIALAFPNVYHVGMSNLGFHVIYEQIVKQSNFGCQRFFMPESSLLSEYERTDTPLLSIEKQERLRSFDVAAFAISFEMDYLYFLKMLLMSDVPIKQSDRSDKDPLIIVGGPCATFNPEPIADFVDAFIIGEGEEVVIHVLNQIYEAQRNSIPRQEILKQLAALKGVYIPSLYRPIYEDDHKLVENRPLPGAPNKIRRQWISNLDDYPARMAIITDHTEFREMFLLEVARGCGRHCRFCMAGYCFRQPRSRSLASLKNDIQLAKKFRQKVGLVGAALSDYPEIDELCQYILSEGMKLSVASLRADSLTANLANALAKSGHRTITLAPEAGSERMRRVINKGLSEEDLHRAIDLVLAAGIPNLRYYIMVGLPFETDKDVEAIVQLAITTLARMREKGSKGKLTLSINPFIPKPFTPFQWLPMAQQKVVKDRLKYIRQALKSYKAIEVLVESTKEAYIQGVLARGDRRIGLVLSQVAQKGSWSAWKSALKSQEIDEAFYLYRERSSDEILPWSHLDMGMEEDYLKRELQQAQQEQYTIPCFAGCHRCGICR